MISRTALLFQKKLLDNKKEYDKMSKAHNPYGDGFASEKIVNFLNAVE